VRVDAPSDVAGGRALLPPPELVLVRYGELSLKGGNRRDFEVALARNIRAAVKRIAPARVERETGRLAVVPEGRAADVARRLQEVFGIKSVSPAWTVESEPDAIVALSRRVALEALAAVPPGERRTFRVSAKRADKRFPLNSAELERYVAERIIGDFVERVRVKMVGAELELGIDVREGRTYVFAERLPGPGGLPVGTLGRVLCLLSGGFDSPVAAWMAMKRGCEVGCVSFQAYPYVGEPSRRQVIDLARVLARWQPRTRLSLVPFAEIQLAVRDSCPEPYRTVLYRRFMQRIAERLALRDRCRALVTGESLGQVASQTLENIRCIEAASSMTVLRPLIGFDKEETLALARRVGTHDVSKRNEPDCCTVFMPRRPVIRGRVEECVAAEAALDVAGLVERAAAARELLELEAED
jgi:thiamine biosynthesis protein ThiI